MGENGMSKLTVFEYPYQYAAWRVNRENPEMVIAERRPFESGRRAVEDYRLCGVYGKLENHTVLQQWMEKAILICSCTRRLRWNFQSSAARQ